MFRVMSGFASILITTLIFFLSILSFEGQGAPAENGEDLRDPIIQLILDPDDREVVVSPGSNGTVSFELEVVCDRPEDLPDDIIWSITLETEAHLWEVTKIPILNFTSKIDRHYMDIEVKVPINTSSEDDHFLGIWGTWTYSDGNETGQIEVKRGFIDILPFYNIYVGCDHPHIGTYVGDRVTFEVMIKNRGNSDINVSLGIIYDPDHIDIGYYDKRTFLAKGERKNITFSVRQEPSRSRDTPFEVIFVIEEDDRKLEYDQELVLKTDPKLSTIFYEWKFTILVVVIGLITLIAISLYIHEKRTGGDQEDRDEDDI